MRYSASGCDRDLREDEDEVFLEEDITTRFVRLRFGGKGGMLGSRKKPRFAEPRSYVLSDWSVHIKFEGSVFCSGMSEFGGIVDAEMCILLFSTP